MRFQPKFKKNKNEWLLRDNKRSNLNISLGKWLEWIFFPKKSTVSPLSFSFIQDLIFKEIRFTY